MTSSDIIPTSIRFPPKLIASVRKLADKQGCSISFKVIEILTSYVEAYKRAHPEERV